jgi:hypothetical protein
VSEEDEVDGIDFAEHGEAAYDLASTSSGRARSVLATAGLREGVEA